MPKSDFEFMDIIEIKTGDGKLILRDRENIMFFVFSRFSARRQPIIFYPERQSTNQVD